ncbi:ParB/RepB/Spo0J family partition protein [Maritalea sp.]|uniref:ParB/RepB/Spo0J family partition protein n=1 Tax=Maritalea sp. TaxID=2003361 RepID=UPI003EF8EECC
MRFNKGILIRVIQALLGHAKLTTTARYARVATGMVAAVDSPLDDLNGAKRKKGKGRPSSPAQEGFRGALLHRYQNRNTIMTLQHIDLDQLTVSPLNVRKFGAKDCADLVASIRALGVLQPLLVREVDGSFEVIAGQRRLNACRIIAEDSAIDPLPCLIMAAGDDAAAIEASLAENIERLPMDEVDQYKAFAKLIKEGRSADEIADTFGITPRMVNQRLALGRLHAPILTAYRNDDVSVADVRNLTMASPKQQKAWWARVKDDGAYAPTGPRLKDWLFGGAHIPTVNALFDVDASGLAVVADLFGEQAYFADAEAFWPQQNAAIAETVEAYRGAGWADVIVMELGGYFATWEHTSTDKPEGGKVFITVSTQGEVTFHEGYITNAEAKRRETPKTGATPQPKPELTKAAQNYVDLHRHAAVRADILGRSDLALRVLVAHMLAGSSLWSVERDPQKTAKPEIADSLAASPAQHAFEAERDEIAALLEIDVEQILPTRNDWYVMRPDLGTMLARLMVLNDEDVLRILTFLMADSLPVTSPILDDLGQDMETDVAQHWQPEQTFFDLIRDKQVLNTMVCAVAGKDTADANLTATAKAQRAILTDCLNGTRTASNPNWMPLYMAFPAATYHKREYPVATRVQQDAA